MESEQMSSPVSAVTSLSRTCDKRFDDHTQERDRTPFSVMTPSLTHNYHSSISQLDDRLKPVNERPSNCFHEKKCFPLKEAQLFFHNALAQSQHDFAFETMFHLAVKIGHTLQRNGQYTDALLYYKQALRFNNNSVARDSKQNLKICADILFRIGVIHGKKKLCDPLKSLQSFELCLDMYTEQFGSDRRTIACVLYHMAKVYAMLDEPETVHEILVEAIALLDNHSANRKLLRDIWKSLGHTQILLGHIDDARSSFKEAGRMAN